LKAAGAASGGIFAFDDLDNTVTISGGPATLTGSTSSRRVVVAGSGISLTLNGVTLTAQAGGAGIHVSGTNATFNLVGTNALNGTSDYPGLGIANSQLVTVSAGSTGTLNVQGTGRAAAIGGDGKAQMTSTVRDSVTFTGRTEAGCGKLTVNGGTVVATHGTGEGAAIGGGAHGAGCTVIVSGGQLRASTTGSGAAIGGGAGEDDIAGYEDDSPGGNGGSVTVEGGTVTARVGNGGSPAVGGGRGGAPNGPTTAGTDGAPGTLSVRAGSVKLDEATSLPSAATVTGGTSGSAAVGLARVAAAGVTSVTVTPSAGAAQNFKIAANHPSDTFVYLYLPHAQNGNEIYTVAVNGSAGSKTYTVTYRPNGDPTVVESGQPPVGTRVLSVTAPTFASVTEGYTQPAAQGVTLRNTGNEALSVASLTSSDTSKFVVSGSGPVSVAAGATNTTGFQVRPAAGLAVGTHSASLTATYNGTSGTTAVATVTIQVTGSSQPPPGNATLTISAPQFAGVVAGYAQPAAQPVTLRSAGDASLTVTSLVSSDPAKFSISGTGPVAMSPDATNSTAFTVRPAAGLAVGTHTATLTAAYNRPAGAATATATVSIVVGSGDQPPAGTRVLSVTAPAFAGVTEGYTQPAAQGVTLRNSGTELLTVSALTSSDPAKFAVTGAGPVALAAGGDNAAAFQVRPAAGLAAGSHSATLTATYDGTSGTTATATVSIVVTAPQQPGGTRELTILAPQFAALTAGYDLPAGQGVTLRNTGTDSVTVSSLTSSNPSKFTVTGSGPVTVAAGSDNTSAFQVRPVAGLAAGIHTATLSAAYNGTSSTTAVAVVLISVLTGDSGGGPATPPPGGGGNTTPPPGGGGNTTPPPGGGGNTTPPPGGDQTPPPGNPTPPVADQPVPTPPPATQPPTFKKVAAKVSAKLVKARIGKTAVGRVKLVVKASGIVRPTGKVKVTIKKGSKTVKTKTYTLAAKAKGKTTLKLPKLPSGTYTVQVAYRGSSAVNAKTVKISQKLRVR
jgi:hypothetical protein